jgi:cell division protein FtsZ
MVKEGLVNLDFADVCSIMSEMGTAMIGTGEAVGERRALRAAEGAIANPLFDDTSLKGARGVLISITGGKDLTLYEVDEAASRIRQEVDEEANIIVGAIVEPALEEAMRVSVVATGIDPAANSRIEHMSAQSSAEPLLHPGATPPARDQTARTPFGTVETHPPTAAVTEIEIPPLPSPVIPFPEPAERRRILDEETRLNPPAIRRPTLLERLTTAASEGRQASGWR